MKNKFSDIESKLKAKFDDAPIAPPNHLWDNIVVKTTAVETVKEKKRFLLFRKRIAWVLLFLTLSVGLNFFLLFNNKKEDSKNVVSNKTGIDKQEKKSVKKLKSNKFREKKQDLATKERTRNNTPKSSTSSFQKQEKSKRNKARANKQHRPKTTESKERDIAYILNNNTKTAPSEYKNKINNQLNPALEHSTVLATDSSKNEVTPTTPTILTTPTSTPNTGSLPQKKKDSILLSNTLVQLDTTQLINHQKIIDTIESSKVMAVNELDSAIVVDSINENLVTVTNNTVSPFNYLLLSTNFAFTSVEELPENDLHGGHFEESYSYGINLLLGKRIYKKRLFLYSGVSLQNIRLIEELNERDIDTVENQFESAFGLFHFEGEEEEDNEILILHQSYFTEIPLGLNYLILNKNKIKINLSASLSASFLIESKNNYSNRISEVSSKNALAKSTYSYSLSTNIEYNLRNHFNLTVEPFYKRYLKSLTTSESMVAKPCLYGLNLGIKKYF